MKITKRELLKHSDSCMQFAPENGLLHAEQIGYIVCTALKNISGRRVLILYFFRRTDAAIGEALPVYVIYQVRDDYITFEMTDSGKTRWLTSSLENLGLDYRKIHNQSAFYSQKDEARVTGFCAVEDSTGFSALILLQSRIMESRMKKRRMAREKIIIRKMDSLPPLPRNLKHWIHKEVLPQYIYYKYHKKKAPMTGYCTACRRDVTVTGAKHNISGECPSCGRAIRFKALGKSSKVWNRATAQVLQKTSERELVLRIIKVNITYRDYREPTLTVWENARIFINQDDEKNLMVSPFYYSYTGGILTDWKKGYRPIINKWLENYEADICGYLYHSNLDDALHGTPWQFCRLKQYCLVTNFQFDVLSYLHSFWKHPALEYLVKFGLINLANELLYGRYGTRALDPNGKNIREVLGIDPVDLPILQVLNASEKQLGLIQVLRRRKLRFDEALLKWYEENGSRDYEDILLPLELTTATKLMRYIEEQFARLKDTRIDGRRRFSQAHYVLIEYRDYLRCAKKLKYKLTRNFVLFPRDLPKAHDLASSLYDVKKSEIFDEQIGNAYDLLLEQYGFTQYGLAIIPPKNASEIVAEGHTLQHCVHTYVEDIADKKHTILFLRQISSIETPFYTVEVRNGDVVQIQGADRAVPTQAVNKFISRWKRAKLLPAARKKAA